MSDFNNIGEPEEKLDNAQSDSLQLLQVKEQEFKVKKLEQELKFLAYQNSKKFLKLERIKALSGLGSIFAALVALGTVIFSVIKWTDDNEELRFSRKKEEFSKLIALTQDLSPQKKVGAFIALRSYLDKNDSVANSQIIMSLTTAMSFEDNYHTRNVLLDVLKELDFTIVDTVTLKQGLTSLVASNRAIAELKSLNGIKNITVASADSSAYPILNKLAFLNNAIEVFLRKNIFIPDMSEIFLWNPNFSDIKFPNKTNFSGCMFFDAELSNVTCRSCNFRDVNFHSARFYKSDFQYSDFSYSEYLHYDSKLFYFMQLDAESIKKTYTGPRFYSCSLQNSRFDLASFVHLKEVETDRGIANIINCNNKFNDCNIKNADFRYLAINDADSTEVYDLYKECVPEIFKNSNWQKAKFTTSFMTFLRTNIK